MNDEITSFKTEIEDLKKEDVMLRNLNFKYQADIASLDYDRENKKHLMVITLTKNYFL